MFDVLGIATADGGPLPGMRCIDDAFTRGPWAGNGHIRLNVDAPGCRLVGLRRAGDPVDLAESAECSVVVIGDVFARLGRQLSGRGRLPAAELLKAYRACGTSLVDDVKGNFTLLLIDRIQTKIHILSSHFAVSPFYYARVEGAVCFATSLGELGAFLAKEPQIDLAAVIEMVMFNWPFHERTFLKGVKRIAPGTVLSFDRDGITRSTYWDQRPLYHEPLLNERDALEHGSELFHECANALVSDRARICASFTSGFDSRALHAVLEKDHGDILSYSFGIPGSINVTVPEKICGKMHYPFHPFYLDRKFEEVFETFARQTVMLSDGVVAQRANYPYAFRELCEFAPVVVTGIFGSEFLRTFQNLGEFVSADFVRLNNSDDPLSTLRTISQEYSEHSYILLEVFNACREEVEADIADWFARAGGFDRNQRLHLYLLEEASRKYFGTEVSTERIYATNLFPFLDVDFFEFIFRAPFAGVHSRAVTPTVSDRFRSQYFYAYLIRKYRPSLLRYTTDHGYPPADLLKSHPVAFAGSKFVWTQLLTRVLRRREFTPYEWLSPFYARDLFSKGEDGYGLLAPRFKQDFQSGAWSNDLSGFDRVAALKLWLEGWH